MSEPTAQRTLVKSPPELWAELSDIASLARHLGEFGDIRITRVEPETTVAWEGDRASGTVTIEPSGWGTKVTLTATPKDPPAEAVRTSSPYETETPDTEMILPSSPYGTTTQDHSPEPAPVAEPEPEPAPLAAQEPEHEPTAVAAEPPKLEAEPAPTAPAPMTANEMLAKSGFFSRMFGRKRVAPPTAHGPAPRGDIGGPAAPTPDPAPPTPAPEPLPPPPAPDPEPPAPEPAPPPPPTGPSPVPDPEPAPGGPDVLPEPTPLRPPAPDDQPPAAAEAPLDVESVLVGVLDTLGAAHHRPFSR